MEKNGALDDLKAEDETIVSEIIALIHEVYNTDEYLNKDATEIPCVACLRFTNLAQASMCCTICSTKGCKNGDIKAFICTLCYYDNGSSSAILP